MVREQKPLIIIAVCVAMFIILGLVELIRVSTGNTSPPNYNVVTVTNRNIVPSSNTAETSSKGYESATTEIERNYSTNNYTSSSSDVESYSHPKINGVPRYSISVKVPDNEIVKLDEKVNIKNNVNVNINYINSRIYEVADRYMQATNLPSEYKEPLILMALSRVETGMYADINITYASAFPTVGESEITPELLDIYDAQRTINNKAYWLKLKPISIKHMGPLQIGIGYGAAVAVLPNELHGTENNQGLSDKYNSFNLSSIKSIPDAGDRFRWDDSCNRVSGVFQYLYSQYSNFDNLYQFISMVGMAHNVGESIFTESPTRKVTATYFPWIDVGNARNYAKAIGSSEIPSQLRTLARHDIEKWRSGVKSKPDLDRSINWSYSILENSSVSSEFYSLKGDYKNRLGYPIRLLYYYMLLEQLYYAGA